MTAHSTVDTLQSIAIILLGLGGILHRFWWHP